MRVIVVRTATWSSLAIDLNDLKKYFKVLCKFLANSYQNYIVYIWYLIILQKKNPKSNQNFGGFYTSCFSIFIMFLFILWSPPLLMLTSFSGVSIKLNKSLIQKEKTLLNSKCIQLLQGSVFIFLTWSLHTVHEPTRKETHFFHNAHTPPNCHEISKTLNANITKPRESIISPVAAKFLQKTRNDRLWRLLRVYSSLKQTTNQSNI